MKIIYLDINRWIELARGWYSNDVEIYPFVEKLKLLVKNGEVRFVISMINIEEIQKRRDDRSRNEVWDFMRDLSQGNYIIPFMKEITSFEVKNLLYSKIGIPLVDIQNWVLSDRIDKIVSFWGGKLVSPDGKDIPPEMIAMFEREMTSLERFDKLFNIPGHMELSRKIASDLEESVGKLEEVRRKERTEFKDKDFQGRVIMARYLANELGPVINSWCLAMNLHPSILFSGPKSIKHIKEVFAKLPSTYTYNSLINERDRDLSRKIKPNDLNDIMQLSVAIPYCDIVWTEREFGNIAKKLKLNKLYSTVIPRNLEEFKTAVGFGD